MLSDTSPLCLWEWEERRGPTLEPPKWSWRPMFGLLTFPGLSAGGKVPSCAPALGRPVPILYGLSILKLSFSD